MKEITDEFPGETFGSSNGAIHSIPSNMIRTEEHYRLKLKKYLGCRLKLLACILGRINSPGISGM